MNCGFLLAILFGMPLAFDSETVHTSTQTIKSESRVVSDQQETPRRFLIEASVWEEIEDKSGKVQRRVHCRPTLMVTEGTKAKFFSGGTIPARVANQSNDLSFGTKLNAVVVAKGDDSARIVCDVSVGNALQLHGDEVRTYSQAFGIACDLKLGVKKTMNFDIGKRKLRLTLEVDAVDPIALQK